MGWGATEENKNDKPNDLRNVRINIYNGTLCQNVLPGIEKDWKRQLCAGKNIFIKIFKLKINNNKFIFNKFHFLLRRYYWK